MGWLIALAVILLLGCLPLGASVRYDADGPLVRLIAGPIRIQLFPAKKKAEKVKKAKEKPEKAKKTENTPTKPKEKKGGKLTDFLPLLQVAVDFLGEFRRKLRVNALKMKLTLAGGDPCDLAVNYGKAWAILGNLIPMLERWFVIKKRDLQVQCDFEGDETRITARLDLTITLGRLLGLAVKYGFRGMREYLKISNKRKGGAVK